MSTLIISVSLAVVMMGVILFNAYRREVRHSSRWISAQLRGSRTPVEFSLRGFERTWDPSAPDKPILDAGQATYTLDDEGMVHLRMECDNGRERTYVGPLPPIPSPHAGTTMRLVLVGYAATLVAGFLIGALSANGSLERRVIWGLVGAVVAMILISVSVRATQVGISIRKLRHSNRWAIHLGRIRRLDCNWFNDV